MFNGFPSTQTPTVQWWDYSKTNTGTINIALPNDCAPVQFFATGGSTTTIQVTLPPNPAQGKTITFKNERYVANTQSIQINDPFPQALQAPCILGQGGSVTFCYIAQNTLKGTGSANWVIISGGSGIAPLNYYAAILSGYQNNATGSHSVVSGGVTNTASNTAATVAGGNSNNASGTYSFVGGGTSNTSSGTSSVTLGDSNGATNTNSISIGGNNNSVSGANSGVFAGSGNFVSGGRTSIINSFNSTATSDTSSIIGGQAHTANGTSSVVLGGRYGTPRSIEGNIIIPASAPLANSLGMSQSAVLILGVQTTDATATVLRCNTSAATTTNQVILPNNSAYVFQGTCIANVTGGSTTSGWKYEGVIKRGANAASTTLVAAVTPTVIAQDVAAATWVLAITADTTNGGIAVTVTGAAATTIRWVSKIETTEVTF